MLSSTSDESAKEKSQLMELSNKTVAIILVGVLCAYLVVSITLDKVHEARTRHANEIAKFDYLNDLYTIVKFERDELKSAYHDLVASEQALKDENRTLALNLHNELSVNEWLLIASQGAYVMVRACIDDSDLRQVVANALDGQSNRASHCDDKDEYALFIDYSQEWAFE